MIWRLAIAILLFAVMPVQAMAAGDKYLELHRAALAGERPVDWTALRYAYSESDQLDLFGAAIMPLRKEMIDAFLNGDHDLALERSAQILDKEFFDIEAWMLCAHVWSERGDASKAETCYLAVDEILESIMGGGDGRSFETAFTVVAVRKEYSLLSVFGMQLETQSLVHKDGHSYDVLKVKNEEGKELELYFQIDRIWAAYGKVLKQKEN